MSSKLLVEEIGMAFFKPLVIDSFAKDPYLNSNDYFVEDRNPKKIYKKKEFEEITYKNKKKFGACWKFGKLALLVLTSMAIIPLILNFQWIKRLWRHIKIGEDIKIVLVANKHLKQLKNQKNEHTLLDAPAKGILKEQAANDDLRVPEAKKIKKEVRIEEEPEIRIFEIDKSEISEEKDIIKEHIHYLQNEIKELQQKDVQNNDVKNKINNLDDKIIDNKIEYYLDEKREKIEKKLENSPREKESIKSEMENFQKKIEQIREVEEGNSKTQIDHLKNEILKRQIKLKIFELDELNEQKLIIEELEKTANKNKAQFSDVSKKENFGKIKNSKDKLVELINDLEQNLDQMEAEEEVNNTEEIKAEQKIVIAPIQDDLLKNKEFSNHEEGEKKTVEADLSRKELPFQDKIVDKTKYEAVDKVLPSDIVKSNEMDSKVEIAKPQNEDGEVAALPEEFNESDIETEVQNGESVGASKEDEVNEENVEDVPPNESKPETSSVLEKKKTKGKNV